MLYLMDIGCNMINADKYIKLFLRHRLKRFNLNATEGLIMLLFLKQELACGERIGMTQDRIIENLQYDKGVITRAMQSLERKGYMIRESNPEDGRSYIFTPSLKTEGIKQEIYRIIEDWSREVFKDIDKAKVKELSEMISKISDNAWNYYNNLDK